MTAGDIAVNLTANTQAFRRGMDAARKDIGVLAGAASAAKTALVGFLTFQGIRGVVGTLTESIGKVDDLAATASQLGVSTEFLSELQYAAKLSDTEVESLNQGLRLLEKNLGNAALEGGDVERILKSMGRSSTELKRIGPERAFLELADIISRVPNAFDRAVLATQLFGKSGQQLLPLLTRGKDAIAALRNEGRNLGVTITEDMALKAGEADDAVKRLTSAWEALKNALAIEVAPTIGGVDGALTKLISGLREGLIPLLGTVNRWLGDVIESFQELVFLNTLLFEGLRDSEEIRALMQEFRDRGKAVVPPAEKPGPPIDLEGATKNKPLKVELKNPAESVFSKEGFSTIARALTPKSQNIPAQQLAVLKNIDKGIGKVEKAVEKLDLPDVGPDF